jgi:hypothetical protein
LGFATEKSKLELLQDSWENQVAGISVGVHIAIYIIYLRISSICGIKDLGASSRPSISLSPTDLKHARHFGVKVGDKKRTK